VRARLAANARHHPGRPDGDRSIIDAVSRERKLRETLGNPPDGATWLEHFRQIAGEAPPLTKEQRDGLALLLGSADGRPAALETNP
jgi:hypothetical protein